MITSELYTWRLVWVFEEVVAEEELYPGRKSVLNLFRLTVFLALLLVGKGEQRQWQAIRKNEMGCLLACLLISLQYNYYSYYGFWQQSHSQQNTQELCLGSLSSLPFSIIAFLLLQITIASTHS